MKRRIQISFIILITACVLFGVSGCKGIVGNGQMETREIKIGKELTGVLNSGSFEVIIDPTLQGKAFLEGESNILELVEAGQNAEGVFEIAFKPDTSILSLQTVKARIPAVNGGVFENNGTGGIRLDGDSALEGDVFDLRVNGTGSIGLNLNAKQLKVGISGTGNVDITGKADKAEIEIKGTGNFNGLNCQTSSANIRIAGTGNASVNTSGELVCSIFGSGNVVYKGNPSKLSVSGAGTGTVNKY